MAGISNRYARAFADVVFDKRLEAAQVRQQLRSLADIVEQNKELRTVWESPALSANEKRHLLDAVVARAGISKPVRNFVAVLIDHERIPLLPQTVRQFEQEVDRRLNTVEVEITSARDLGPDETRMLERQIAEMVGKTVRARYERDPNIMGGAVIKIGSTIYDGSILGQLNKLREQLSAS